ncbi:hypothetical protein V5O48_001677 [Marasmius crinis-equi]|uniref:DUF7082 domain-containing protein n=1 Tax=Marasmius crinis-equi TaxID=585013 RepID=A0ABR3FXT9_9AGAR
MPSLSPPTTTPSQSAATSPNKMFHVLDYSPKEGEKGVPITVRIHFNHSSSNAIFVRLVVGSRAVATKVREVPDVIYGRWQLDATVPALDPLYASDKVLLSVQALDQGNNVLDSVTFGEFSYWLSDRSNLPSPKSEPIGGPSHRRQTSLEVNQGSSNSPVLRRRAATTSGARPLIPGHGALTPDHLSIPSKSRPLKGVTPRRVRANSLMRSKFAVTKDLGHNLYPQQPVLEIIDPLDKMCSNWDTAEIRAGRRLVRFTKVQDGPKIVLYSQSIRQEEYQDTDSVISCIYRDETDSCYVTSVDVIYLLERLTNNEFPVEEKNRIRRNLEGLRPTTVSKHKPGFEPFFQRIMEFPDPKPRNIEKDLKVFEWSSLGDALERILKKYSVYTHSSPTDSTDSTASLPSELNDEHPVYKHIDTQGIPKLAHPTPLIPKFEPSFNDRSILLLSSQEGTPDGGISHPSKHAYDTLQHYPLYPSDPNHTMSDQSSAHEEAASFNTWADGGGPGDIGLEDYHTLSAFQLADIHDGQNVQNDQPDYNYDYSSESAQYPKEATPAYFNV